MLKTPQEVPVTFVTFTELGKKVSQTKRLDWKIIDRHSLKLCTKIWCLEIIKMSMRLRDWEQHKK